MQISNGGGIWEEYWETCPPPGCSGIAFNFSRGFMTENDPYFIQKTNEGSYRQKITGPK